MPWPASAGPTGGAGFAFPACKFSLTIAFNFFATFCSFVVLTDCQSFHTNQGTDLKSSPFTLIYPFSTCRKSSSTGVSPKEVHHNANFDFSRSISDTVPRKSLKGPSTIRTFSPILYVTLTTGASASIRFRIEFTSSWRKGVGWFPMPTNRLLPAYCVQ